MTEDEAKTKWCPFVRAAGPADPASGYLCIGSACMAWRWGAVECEPPYGSGGISTAELLRLRPNLTPYHNPADTKRLFAVPSGRCGLAEKPA